MKQIIRIIRQRKTYKNDIIYNFTAKNEYIITQMLQKKTFFYE